VYSVDIDVGGTLTDGIFTDGQRVVCAKVDSTAHDLTVCLFDCLTQGASQLGFADLTSFLEHVDLLRWSTTITSNVLAELRGPKIGLIVSRGHERDLYGDSPVSPALNRVVSEFNIIGVDGAGGNEILAAVRSLLENGVRRICISLAGALHDPEHEQQIKKTIEEQYPDHFLGSVPVLAGSDICKNTDDMTRTYFALINAYTHSALASTLFKAEDELRYTQGYSRAFLISHINGGVAGVSKTRAIDTMESGPILGIYGASYLAKRYGLKNVIALDVGGTTAKIGLIQNGEPVYSAETDLFGIPLRTRLPYLRSIALGGGSVVQLNGEAIQLGPESMGSFPGPVCYVLGGEKPALTDAFVTAGLIDPEYFLAATKHLDQDAARIALENDIARPLGISTSDACAAIIERAYEIVAGMIAGARQELQQDLADHALFAYGGNGGLFACGVAERTAIRDVYLFDLGPVFSAFGSSVSDILHTYEESFHLAMQSDQEVTSLNRLIDDMRATGLRDLRGEGIKSENADFTLELEFSGKVNIAITCPFQHFRSMDDLRRILPTDSRKADLALEVVRLQMRQAISRPALLERVPGSKDAAEAMIGTRNVSYGSPDGKARIYKWESLQPGATVRGCALLESETSTYFVPEGWSLTIDSFGNAQLRWDSRRTSEATTSGQVQESRYGK
jgi:N-methylhydantoinase A